MSADSGDGDGWVHLPDGSRRWGRYGSAGLLLCADSGGAGGGRVLMQHRAVWSHQGGTWGVPGGAMNSDEDSVSAALREFGEEVAGDVGDIELIGLHRQEHTVWRYDTVLARTAAAADLEPANWESDDLRWVDVADIDGLRLLPAFGSTWPLLREALAHRLALVVDAAAVLARTGGDAAGGAAGGPDPDGGAALLRLRDDLAALGAAGVAAGALPAGLAPAGLHLWYPRTVLVTDGAGTAPPPVPGVEVAAAAAGAPGAPGAAGAPGAFTVAVTDRPGAFAGAERTAVVGPEWLESAAAAVPRPDHSGHR
ncbi:NUDIX domain-containing protein [Streptomonospora sp. S1-112]|uniref:NUDIX domain-containing protein n=1 Tax=Streptomonospora mangrovi TaxID=2883123 RepID=A0A9X3NJ26_9ACTN|nr:NUDIX domain-containing protein [Streptomonospora mangrovi]MDA0564652.1 NUDIX domain-containing protein [Streptomonospora mangrovi]